MERIRILVVYVVVGNLVDKFAVVYIEECEKKYGANPFIQIRLGQKFKV